MRDGFTICDVDRHVIEPIAMWAEYLPRAMRAWAPALQPWPSPAETLEERLERLGDQALSPVPPVPAVRGKPLYRGMTESAYIELGEEALRRHAAVLGSASGRWHLDTMDASGIDVAVLLPTYASYLVHDDEVAPEVSRAYAAAYNRWLGDLRSVDTRRLRGAAVVSCHEPGHMVSDLEAALQHDPVAVVLRPNPVLGRTLAHPTYRPFWEACQGNDLAVLLHEGTHARVATAGADRFETRFGQHACSHPLEAMMALLSLVEGGVLDAHPGLRVGLLEAGCGWLPYWLWRLDEVEYSRLRAEVAAHVRRAPSEYVRAQCWVAVEAGEPCVEAAAASAGADRLVFGTDIPHLDHDDDPVGRLLGGGLPRDLVRTMLWSNAARLLNLPATAQEPGAVPLTPPSSPSRT
ncbi:MAG TPA: amidohydrolase family protein [Polyangiaceae bacterium]